MHDPSTVAFDIKRPWPVYRAQPFLGSHWYWPTLVTIWHEDPETDGSDDSCGWSRPKLTKAQVSGLDFFAGCEARSPWYLAERAKQPQSASDAETLLCHALLMVAGRLKVRTSLYEVAQWSAQLLGSPIDNLRSSLCYLPGYHSNSQTDTEEWRREAALSLFCCLARYILRERRPWYRHPKWHLWHWRIQVHPLQAFKRWVFSRCAGCQKRFRYGYAPTSRNWNGTGPRWFNGESGVYHSECFPSARPVESGAKTTTR